MAGFDAGAIYTNDTLVQRHFEDDNPATLQIARRKFRDFFNEFNDGNFVYKYRDQLKRNYNLQQYHVTVDVQDLSRFDETLGHQLVTHPNEYLPLLEEAAASVAEELTRGGPEHEETADRRPKVQVLLTSDSSIIPMRHLKSDQVSRLVKVSGIVIAASAIRAKATHLSLQCRGCREFMSGIPVRAGLEGYTMPRRCPRASASAAAGGGIAAATGATQCPVDPFFIVPDKCHCVDFQLLKLQESPEAVPQGEVPRHMQLYCESYMCERVVPGNRVTVVGVFAIKRSQLITNPDKKGRDKTNVGVKQPYIRVLGLGFDTEVSTGAGTGVSSTGNFTEAEEEEFRRLASQPDIYERLSKSIAPSIFGSLDIKKAITCLLFGGSRKRLPDGLYRRGDINVLLLGDPGTAKSQLLKFVERCAPIAVYTSGKGSSAAGLTASVNRDPATRNFVMEGGAMVLADGGVVCIDEFDKMREDDRVAIHEAMEQQTISIAKAGITTTLNSRCSVLAAANSVFGRWDDMKGEENIDFMPTILSRFDTIFVVKDEHNEEKDKTLARHVMQVHMRGGSNDKEGTTTEEGEIPLNTLRRYIAYCRKRCGPRISVKAADKLRNQYVLMRSGASMHERETGKKTVIPITVRQLEAIIRISESLAKMRLAAFATERDVEEALRIFQVSTLEAAMAGHLEGAEGFTSQEDHELLLRVEKQIKRRFVIGSQVSEHTIVQDFVKQGYPEPTVNKVLSVMIRRGEVQHRMQRRILYRIQ